MSESFDPYHVWLGIPPESRPPTHYELLGISPNEQDRAVIEAAMLRQSGYVRNFQIGKYAKDATKVLNEIAAAKTCLLDPAKRAKYDAELKARRPAAIQVPSQAPSIPSAVAAVAPALDLDLLAATAAPPALRPSQRRRSTTLTLKPRKEKASSIAWHLPAGIGISVCALLAALALWPKSAHEPPQPQPDTVGTVVHTASVELDQAETEPPASQPQLQADNDRAASPPPVASLPSGSLPISTAAKAAAPRAISSPHRLFLGTHCDWHFKAILLTPLAVDKAAPPMDEYSTDLLKTIDLKKHTRGGWAFDGPVLVSPPNVIHAGVRFPGVVPDEYRLRIVAERPRGYQGPPQFHVGLVTRSSQATLVLDADHKSGLETVGGKLYGGNATTFAGDLFIDAVDSTIDCTVGKDSIRVDFDGHTIIDWHGDLKQLSPTWSQFGAPKRAFWIGTHCNWRIKKVELFPLTKE